VRTRAVVIPAFVDVCVLVGTFSNTKTDTARSAASIDGLGPDAQNQVVVERVLEAERRVVESRLSIMRPGWPTRHRLP
jgi:hypothetical protein